MAKRRNSTGVYKRYDGRYNWVIKQGTEGGNPKVVANGTCKTEAEAIEKRQQALERTRKGEKPIKQRGQTVSEFIAYWLENHVEASKSPKTFRFYAQMTRLYIEPNLGGSQLSEVGPEDVQTMLNRLRKRNLSERTVSHVRAVTRTIFSLAVEEDKAYKSPVRRASAVKVEKRDPVYLEPSECSALLQSCRSHYLARLIELGMRTGLRLGEATGLTWNDVDFEKGILQIRQQLQRVTSKLILRPLKTGSSRRNLPVSSKVLELLRAQRANQLLWKAAEDEPFNELGLCFTGEEGRPIDQKTVDKHLKRFTAKAGIGKAVSYHKLRHTFASLAGADGQMNEVKAALGHSQISLTADTYSHIMPSALKETFASLDNQF